MLRHTGHRQWYFLTTRQSITTNFREVITDSTKGLLSTYRVVVHSKHDRRHSLQVKTRDKGIELQQLFEGECQSKQQTSL